MHRSRAPPPFKAKRLHVNRSVLPSTVPFTPPELAAEHARAMRIVGAVLNACDARAATARAAREHNLKPGDAPWILAFGKAAIGMAEGIVDVCGEPERHLIVTVDGPPPVRLASVHRSDHPLPTERSVDAGRAVKRFIEEAKAAGVPALTVLISGGTSSLICEPIPGLELGEYRAVVRAMLEKGWEIRWLNTVRRAIDALKGGRLAAFAEPMAIDLFAVSDVIGDRLDDIGSGPFAQSSTGTDQARALLETRMGNVHGAALVALTCQPHPPRVRAPRRAAIVLNSQSAVDAAHAALVAEGMRVISATPATEEIVRVGVSQSAAEELTAGRSGDAIVWGGEWDVQAAGSGYGGRMQSHAIDFRSQIRDRPIAGLFLATDGIDGRPPTGAPPAAGAFVWTGMSWPGEELAGLARQHRSLADAIARRDTEREYEAVYDWLDANSYLRLAWRDANRPPGEPPAHIFTGPTGTNVNDLLVAWRLR